MPQDQNAYGKFNASTTEDCGNFMKSSPEGNMALQSFIFDAIPAFGFKTTLKLQARIKHRKPYLSLSVIVFTMFEIKHKYLELELN